ncbi:fumarate reductase subunit FrdC [Aggregatibacter actinomycetemcomitans]|uniref:fumarate reductase subunit FrdC n=1 Tax=Aggregatibacter actinomycetemcomitans TaxID=714 RepID=UPI00022AD6DA|nr:fumarate reductase subunit FrdC [Aggregatibacter actinomycetemcomitans]KOE65262.1 fumarate reductase [Aggregatibacter actinomycetemcomitans serotype e str. A160]KOE67696.1 fumarate reductase [Aggregatibacter actinomycetemcomitans serotype e str. SCC393]KYK80575.1 fumarate reductase [Aggregatibacter actinomycetemcomitans serotype e str. SA2876]
MTTTATKRKKYVREIPPTWWKSWDFYKFYMVREATALPTVWFSLVLLYGVICLGKADGFIASFIPFLQNPIVVILNIISLAALLLHAVTLFDMTGEVMSGSTGLPPTLIKNALRGLFVAVTVLALVLVFI